MLNMCSLIYTSLGRETSYIQKCIKLYESDIKDRKSLLTGTVHVNNSLLAENAKFNQINLNWQYLSCLDLFSSPLH